MTKSELASFGATKREIEQIKGQIEALRAAAESPKAQILSGMPSGKGGNTRTAEGYVILAEKLMNEYEKKLKILLEKQVKIEKVIEDLPSDYKVIMRKRYIECLRWERIADELNYSWRQLHRIHSKILYMIADR